MQRQFKIMDDNRSGTIEPSEFEKAIKDFRIDLTPQEMQMVYSAFDIDESGSIDYNEFVRGVRGPMNAFRKNLVRLAFKRIDRDGSGMLDINDIKQCYNARMHPDVKSGKKTEDDILGEFLETFEVHHNLLHDTARDQVITFEEFTEYYNNISASVDND